MDRWPENDELSISLGGAGKTECWYVSSGSGAGDGFRAMRPADLPTDAAAYLAPSLIVLDNLAASDLNDAQLARIEQYVRDLGGGLLITGGDRAFGPWRLHGHRARCPFAARQFASRADGALDFVG